MASDCAGASSAATAKLGRAAPSPKTTRKASSQGLGRARIAVGVNATTVTMSIGATSWAVNAECVAEHIRFQNRPPPLR